MFPMIVLHWRLTGSTLGNLAVVGAIMGAVGVLAMITFGMAEPRSYDELSGFWLMAITIAQTAMLMLFAPGALRKALQQDFDSGLIDSHRLTPQSDISLVFGYLTGPAVQVGLLYAASIVLGMVFAAIYTSMTGFGGVVMMGWWAYQFNLIFPATLFATLVLATGLAGRGKTPVINLLVIGGIMGGWGVAVFVPGLALLAGVLNAERLLRAATAPGGQLPATLAGTTMLLQFGFIVLLVGAACRKIRRSDLPMFNLPMALALATLAMLTLLLGLWFAADSQLLEADDDLHVARIYGSLAAYLLFAQIAVISAASARWRARRAAALGQAERRPVGAYAAAALLAIAGLSLLLLIEARNAARAMPPGATVAILGEHLLPLVPMLLAVGLSIWIDYCWLEATIARGKRVVWAVVLSLVILKALPVVLAAAISWRGDPNMPTIEAIGPLAGLSPVGNAIVAAHGLHSPWPGIVGLLVMAVVAEVVRGRVVRRQTPVRAAAAAAS